MGQRTDDLSTLIPIKGISNAMKKKLASDCGIHDISGLLLNGRTVAARADIAARLETKSQYVTNWVKQADLWRVPSMTTDLAFVLTLVGVRCTYDLAKVDTHKLRQAIDPIFTIYPDFDNPGDDVLLGVVLQAFRLFPPAKREAWMPIDTAFHKAYELLSKASFSAPALIRENDENQTLLNEARELLGGIIQQAWWLQPSGEEERTNFRIEFDGEDLKEPVHLFREKRIIPKVKTESEIITEGLLALLNVDMSLPLPRTIMGAVKMRGEQQSSGTTPTPQADILVRIEGIASPTDKKPEKNEDPSSLTDGEGKFVITLPDRYNLQEKITFTLTQGGYKQTFVRMASEILERVFIPGRKDPRDPNDPNKRLYANELLELLAKLDSVNKEIFADKQIIDAYEQLQHLEREEFAGGGSSSGEPSGYYSTEEFEKKYKPEEVKKHKEKKEEERRDLLKMIFGVDFPTKMATKSLSDLFSRTDLCVDLGDLILSEKIFKGFHDDKPRVLPSVKLMGEGDDAIRLPTDTAPSRMFTYSMLQRLVEPTISNPSKGQAMERVKLQRPIDAMSYKRSMAENAHAIPQASSLGIGYVLNMHQAWVPDGFALGTLLYSTVLAPGEEQRLIVRERNQSYSLSDVSEGSDSVRDRYGSSQVDDTSAAYNYAINQMSAGDSQSAFRTSSTSVGGSLGFSLFGVSVGASVGHSSSSGSASSSARQSNAAHETSSAAQRFQHFITSASERLSQARRVSISSATGSETDSVATRIIANHNHSHAMTIQYWEVMRRYRLETCIDGVDLVLFVPMSLIPFLPEGQRFYLDNFAHTEFTREHFKTRYDTLLRYFDMLHYRLPYRYRAGLELLQRYASYPMWKMERIDSQSTGRTLLLTLKGKFLPCDNISVTLQLKNNKGSIIGEAVGFSSKGRSLADLIQDQGIKQRSEIDTYLRGLRSQLPTEEISYSFSLPASVTDEDLSRIRIENNPSPLKYQLAHDYEIDHTKGKLLAADSSWMEHNTKAVINYLDRLDDLYKDDDKIKKDIRRLNHYYQGLPDNFIVNELQHGATLSPQTIIQLSPVVLLSCSVSDGSAGSPKSSGLSSNRLQYNAVYIELSQSIPILKLADLQRIEATLQHVATETMHYSQCVWASLSDNERVLMLDQYTVEMDFQRSQYYAKPDKQTAGGKKTDEVKVPLLNCINVKKMLGFYGNCMIFPFTYPEELAEKLGKTSAEVQESLYRYHTSCFRVPSTSISLPTEGMIGEAVLGETNVSEEIDLTRFWNWKDSPIDSMPIGPEALTQHDLLADKKTKDISALGLSGASAPTAVTAPEILKALTSRPAPTFADITAANATAQLLQQTGVANTNAQANMVTQNAEIVKKALEYQMKKLETEAEARKQEREAEKAKAKEAEKKETPEAPKPDEKGEDDKSKGKGSTTPPSETKPNEKGEDGKNEGKGPATPPAETKPDEPKADPGTAIPPSTGKGDRYDQQRKAIAGIHIKIDELGFTGLSDEDTQGIKCRFFSAVSGGDDRLKHFAEYKRLRELYGDDIVRVAAAYCTHYGFYSWEQAEKYGTMIKEQLAKLNKEKAEAPKSPK